MQDYQDRYRGLTQETNMTRYLDKFCSDQAMTLDELGIFDVSSWWLWFPH